ncbi:hypothetical protein GCM10027056_18950 [Glaciibacter psychrotolerans]
MTGLPAALQQHEAERLSLIRYQLMVAGQQVQQPAPLNSLALGSMQDAVESMFGLVVEHLHIATPNRNDFLQLFDAVAGRVEGEPAIVGYRSGIAAMNLARVNFKHHGNQAESGTIGRHLGNSTELIGILSQRVFGVEIESVSLLLFVRDQEARAHLELAQSHWSSGEPDGAMDELKLAFDRITRDYESRKAWHPGRSLFSTKPSFMPSIFDIRKAGKEAEKAFEWLESLDGWVKMLALGIDMRRYAYFDAHTPSAVYTLDGAAHLHRREGVLVNEEVFAKCMKFVVDTSLAFAQDDFDFDAWAARQAVSQGEGV